MDDLERAVLEAAFDLAQQQRGYDLGVQNIEHVNSAFRDLMDACSELASENDGRLVVRENGEAGGAAR